MFTENLIAYLEELKANNNKTWFDANRARYDSLRAEFTDLVDTVIQKAAETDGALGGASAADSLFRINRDIRFSKDKTPYKTSFSAMIGPGKKDMGSPGYYFHINADGELMVGCGIYDLPPERLTILRSTLLVRHHDLTNILNKPAFKSEFPELRGEKLKGVPKDYPADHPAGEYLKYKGLMVGRGEPVEGITDEVLFERVTSLFKLMYPFVAFLRDAVSS